MTIEIPLTRGQIAVIDDIDADLAELKWFAQFLSHYATGEHFVAGRSVRIGSKRTMQLLHRVVLARIVGRDLVKNEEVDHIDRNSLNNQRSNLRLATRSQNNANRGVSNSTGYKGVRRAGQNRWQAVISVNGKLKALGRFSTPEAAHEAYKKAALEMFGEFARFE